MPRQDNSIPPFSSFEPLLAQPYTPALFASSLVPDGLPEPSELVRMAKAIHPHWAERKQERRGRSIIPDVNVVILLTLTFFSHIYFHSLTNLMMVMCTFASVGARSSRSAKLGEWRPHRSIR
jgi:hypothetical protein